MASWPISMSEARRVLGVGPDARPREIEAAFRRRARQTHPDNGGEPATFRRVVAARARLLGAMSPPGRPVPSAPVIVVRRRRWWQQAARVLQRPRPRRRLL